MACGDPPICSCCGCHHLISTAQLPQRPAMPYSAPPVGDMVICSCGYWRSRTPEHDSVYQRFVQLDQLLEDVKKQLSLDQCRTLMWLSDAQDLLGLLRAQVLR